MLCTHCTREVRPVVAVDIDGTLGDYHGHFLDFAAAYLGMESQLDWLRSGGVSRIYGGGKVEFRHWFAEQFNVDVTTFREIKLAYRAGGQKRTMPVYPGAGPLMVSLIQMNVEVWLTTTRPYLRLDGVDKDTRFWLDRHGLAYEYLLYDEDKYSVLASQLDPARVVAVLDDEAAQLHKAGGHFGPTVPILRRQRYNRNTPWAGEEAINLIEALQLIAVNIQQWRARQHASAAN